MPPTDPFYLVKDDIQASIDNAQTKYLQWQSAARAGPERRQLESDIDDECKSIAWQVDEMAKAVDVAESNMARFGLTPQELASRRKWVNQTREQCESIAAGLKTPQTAPRSNGTASSSAASKYGAAVRNENDRHINSESEQQQSLIRRQDEDLDQLGEHVVRIGQMGRQIGEELTQQGELLYELDTDIDGTTNRLAAAQKKMNLVLQKAGLKGQMAIIGILIVLLVVLLLLAFS